MLLPDIMLATCCCRFSTKFFFGLFSDCAHTFHSILPTSTVTAFACQRKEDQEIESVLRWARVSAGASHSNCRKVEKSLSVALIGAHKTYCRKFALVAIRRADAGIGSQHGRQLTDDP